MENNQTFEPSEEFKDELSEHIQKFVMKAIKAAAEGNGAKIKADVDVSFSCTISLSANEGT